MGSTTFPAASSAGKTMYRTTLTSGTSYTVPTGVTYLNVTLVGGGGGGAGGTSNSSANNGLPGQLISSTLSATAGNTIAYAIGAGGAGATTETAGGAGGTTTFTGATSADGGGGGNWGPSTSAVAKSGYANNGGMGGPRNIGYGTGASGGGGAGCIYVEYWA